jgi:hypothetical protein
MIRYNTSLSTFEGFGTAWGSLGGVKSVDGFTYIIAETSAGASNGDLDFFAENNAGTAAQQVGQWNRNNLVDFTGTIRGTQATQNVFDGTATTVNAFGAATNLNMGSSSGTATLRNGTVVGVNTTQNLWNSTATTINFGGSASINMSASGRTTAIAGAATIGQTLGVTGATTLNSTLAVTAGSTFTGAVAVNNTLTVQAGQALVTNNITTGGSGTAGTMTGTWTLSAGSRFQATYADLAERYKSDENYEPGTVLMIGGEAEVTVATLKGKNKLAGIVSTNPAYVLNAMEQGSVIIGLAGRVPCFVVGKIEKGDMLTISAIPGVATSTEEPIAVIGRALENYDSNEVGMIEVMIGRA